MFVGKFDTVNDQRNVSISDAAFGTFIKLTRHCIDILMESLLSLTRPQTMNSPPIELLSMINLKLKVQLTSTN